MMTYLHIGTDTLSPLLFREVTFDNSVKPSGGLWLTKQESADLYNPWVSYLSEHPHILFFKHIWDGYSIPCCLLTLKENTNLCQITNDTDLQAFYQKYRHQNYLDWIAVCQNYDGIELTFKNLSVNPLMAELAQEYCLDSTILFNLDCILNYRSGQVLPRDMYDDGYFDDYTFAFADTPKEILPWPETYPALLTAIKKFVNAQELRTLTLPEKAKIGEELNAKITNQFQAELESLAQENQVSAAKLSRTIARNILI